MSAPDHEPTFADGTPLPPDPDGPPVSLVPDDADHAPVPVLAPPRLSPRCLYGLIGEVVRMIEPHTEADPAAMLTQAMSLFGCLVGPSAFIRAGDAKHHAVVWPLIIGETSRGAKGTSLSAIRRVFDHAVPTIDHNVSRGIGSGEGLIALVHDGEGDDPDKRSFVEGVHDKRHFVLVSEFHGLLKKVQRDGSILGETLCDTWDGTTLQVQTKSAPIRATGHHIAVVGHVTPAVLSKALRTEDLAGGMMNRFLPVHSQASKSLASGGNTPPEVVSAAASLINGALSAASEVTEVTLSDEAQRLWELVYSGLKHNRPAGRVGEFTARAAPNVLRLALVYALADGAHEITGDHLEAALQLWDYVEDTARWLYSTATAETRASEERNLIEFITAAGPDGVTKWQITNELYKRHKKAPEIDAILSPLVHSGRIQQATVKTKGRPKTILRVPTLEGI